MTLNQALEGVASSRVGAPRDMLAPSGSDRAAPAAELSYEAGATVEEEGCATPRLRLVQAGWLAATRTLADGRRQILRLFVPGDLCGVGNAHGSSQCATMALTRARTADLGPARASVPSESPEHGRLAARIRAAAAADEAALLVHMVRLGRMSAYERTAHLLLELFERLTRAGLAHGSSIPMPLTQEVLADTLGLSIVHINRTLQQLRRQGLITSRPGRIVFPDLDALAQACGYTFEGPAAGGERGPTRAPARSWAPAQIA
jgi:CRP-like cAMP-binding protein